MAKTQRRIIKKKLITPAKCFFCEEKKEPKYSDTSDLQKFISDRGKILSRSRSGICANHQRHLSDAVKYARHLALLPFISRD
jgi:small subunit ribosomal protein S18